MLVVVVYKKPGLQEHSEDELYVKEFGGQCIVLKVYYTWGLWRNDVIGLEFGLLRRQRFGFLGCFTFSLVDVMSSKIFWSNNYIFNNLCVVGVLGRVCNS